MWAERDRKVPFDLRNVGIRFKMLFLTLPVREFMIYGPVITIDEAKRL
jgi:hypothetical protein